MNFEELLVVVKKINAKRPTPVDDHLLVEIIVLIVKNPLDDDRARSQDQIAELIAARVWG